MKDKIFIFYHAFLTDNQLVCNIFTEQLYAIMMSGLLSSCEKLYINVCCSSENDYLINTIINHYNVDGNIHVSFTRGETDERSTSQIMKNVCDEIEEDFFVLYLHTKGSTKINTPQALPTKYWRHFMEYYNVFKWRDCISKLKDSYESCGIMWHPNNHYSGNFFWMKSSLLKTIPNHFFGFSPNSDRFSVEALPSRVSHKYFDFYTDFYENERFNLYNDIFKPKNYID